MKKFVFLLAALAATFTAAAQTIPVNPKFGAVSDAEIDLKVYEPDTSAVAVMLYRDYSLELTISNEGKIVKVINVHERIKVLKEEGKKFGDYSFLYYSSNSLKEFYSNIKAETFNREDGKVVRTKMSKKYEFDEKFSDDLRRRSWSAENVKVGSVIEVSYRLTSPRYYDIDNIDIQLTIPVNMTHIEAGYAEYFRVNRTQRGYVSPQFRQTDRVAKLGTTTFRIDVDNYDAVDVPALPSESHCFCPSQYRSAILYDMSGVVIPGSVYESISMKWTDVDEAIAESDIMDVIKGKFRDSQELNAALEGVEGDEARIAAVRNFIAGKVKWDETSHLVPEKASTVLKQGAGSDADINALTASALNTLGYVAEPVMVRRRTSGILMDFHISLRSFDTFILRVSTPDGSQSWYLDAARKEGYLNVLDPRFLVEQARLIHLKGDGEWVDLTNISRSRANELVNAKISEDGTMTGTVSVLGINEESFDIKQQYNDFDNEDEFLETLEAMENIEITRFEIENNYGPTVSLSYDFEKETDSSDRIYVNPFLRPFHAEKDFQKEERKLPVDFPYPENLQYTFNLDIPEGYAVEEMPKDASLSCPPVKGRIQFKAQEIQNRITLVYRFTMDTTMVLPEDYADLRLFWETAAGIEKSTIVLKKK